MVADRTQRLRAASALARFLGSKAWQEAIARGDFISEQQVILALESDRLSEIHLRMQKYEPPVHIAVYHPCNAKGIERLTFVVMEPALTPPDPEEDVVEIDPASTVGMFFDYLDRKDRVLHVRLTRWQSPLVVREVVCA